MAIALFFGIDHRGSGCLLLHGSELVSFGLVCSTCVWHYCDKAARPLWGNGECQRLERRREQLPNIWWNEEHTLGMCHWRHSVGAEHRAEAEQSLKRVCEIALLLSLINSICSIEWFLSHTVTYLYLVWSQAMPCWQVATPMWMMGLSFPRVTFVLSSDHDADVTLSILYYYKM